MVKILKFLLPVFFFTIIVSAQTNDGSAFEYLKRFKEEKSVVGKLNLIIDTKKIEYIPNKSIIDKYLDSLEQNKFAATKEGARFNLARGHIYHLLNYNKETVRYLQEALNDSMHIEPGRIFRIYSEMYDGFQRMHNYGACVHYLKKIKTVLDTVDINSRAYKELVKYVITEESTYYNAGMYSRAVAVLKPKYEHGLLSNIKDQSFLLSSSNNLGLYYLANKQPDSAVFYFRKSLSHFNKVEKGHRDRNKYILALLKGNLGEAYFDNKEYALAEKFLKEDVAVNKEFAKISACWSAILVAKCLLQIGNISEAKDYLDLYKNSVYNASGDLPKLKIAYYEALSLYYTKLRQYQKSLELYQQASVIKDSVYRAETNAAYLKSELAFIISTKDIELAYKSKELNDLKEMWETKDDAMDRVEDRFFEILILSIILLLLLLYVIMLLYNRKKVTMDLKELNGQILHQNEIIEGKIHEKEESIKTINESYRSCLQLVFKIIEKEKENKVDFDGIKYSEVVNRINGILTLHEEFYKESNLDKIDMVRYMEMLVEQEFSKNIKVNLAISSVFLNLERASSISMLAYELYIHELKRSKNYPETQLKLVVSLMEIKEGYHFVFQDNLPAADNTLEKAAINLPIINEFTKKLEGHYKFKFDKGLFFELVFKK